MPKASPDSGKGKPKALDREEGWDIPPISSYAPWSDFYSALGRFIQMFGKVESSLHVVLRDIIANLLNATYDSDYEELIAATTGSMRVAGLRDAIKRVLRVGRINDVFVNEFEYGFAHLGEIHFMRDRIAHHGCGYNSEGAFYTTNDETVSEFMNGELILFEIENLLDMAYDLKRLEEYFSVIEISMHGDVDESLGAYLRFERPTWRYKSSSLKRAGPKHWPSPHKPKPRRAPSEE